MSLVIPWLTLRVKTAMGALIYYRSSEEDDEFLRRSTACATSGGEPGARKEEDGLRDVQYEMCPGSRVRWPGEVKVLGLERSKYCTGSSLIILHLQRWLIILRPEDVRDSVRSSKIRSSKIALFPHFVLWRKAASYSVSPPTSHARSVDTRLHL